MTYFTEKSIVRFHAEVTYDGITIRESDNTLAIRQELGSQAGMTSRVSITNVSDRTVRLESAFPIVTDEITIKDSDPKTWRFLKECRHKNDLPGSFSPMKKDEAFTDAFNTVSESGSIEDAAVSATLESDEILVISAPECAVAFSFRTAGTQLTRIVTEFDEGIVRGISVGGDFAIDLAPGRTVYSEWAAVETADDPYAALDHYAGVLGYDPRTVWVDDGNPVPFVYSTWYYYGELVEEADVIENLGEIVGQKLPFSVFQIDDGWERCYGDWEANDRFPHGMAAIAQSIRDAGLAAGIWTCPFTVRFDSDFYRTHGDWMLRDRDGEPIRFRVMEDFAVLDLTNPAVLDWLGELYGKLTEWGYNYHKLDFTRCAVMFPDADYYDKGMTVVEAYVRAMNVIRKAIGNSYLLICGGLYDCLAGICDGQRTGSDVKSMWLDEGQDRPKIPITVKQNSYRAFMNAWWHNDADALMVRRDPVGYKVPALSRGLLTDDEAELFCANQYFSGGLVSASERLSVVDKDRLLLLRHLYPILPTKVKPLGLFDGERYISRFEVELPGRWVTVCAVNWTDEEAPFTLVVPEMKEGETFLAASFFGGKRITGLHPGDQVSFGMIRPHAVEIVKIARDDVPQVVGSNMHYSMGGEVTVDEAGNVHGTNAFAIPAHYTVRMPDGRIIEREYEGYAAF